MKKLLLGLVLVSGLFADNSLDCDYYFQESLNDQRRVHIYLQDQDFENAAMAFVSFDDNIVRGIATCTGRKKESLIKLRELAFKVYRKDKK